MGRPDPETQERVYGAYSSGNIIGRTLKTLSEHNEATPDELVLEDGERVLIHATEKGIHVGCVTLTFKAVVGLRNKLAQLLAVKGL